MNCLFLVCLLIPVVFAGAYLHGAEYEFDRISIDDGFPFNVVYSIIQDKKGFLWLAGEGGLVRYDGRNFKNYGPRFGNSALVPDNTSCIHEDGNGIIWCATWGQGIVVFDPEMEVFRYADDAPPEAGGLNTERIHTVYRDKGRHLWFGTYEGGLKRLDPQTGTVARFKPEPGTLSAQALLRVWAVVEDHDGTLWVGTSAGLCRMTGDAQGFTHYRQLSSGPEELRKTEVRTLCVDAGGILWLGTRIGLYRFDPRNNAWSRYLHGAQTGNQNASDIINRVYFDEAGLLWVGTVQGLFRFQMENRRFIPYHSGIGDDASGLSNDIRSICRDRTGILWAGTRGGGLIKINLKPKEFHHLPINPALHINLKNKPVTSIFPDGNGGIWMGSNGGGLDYYNRETGTYRHYQHDPADPHSLGANYVRTVYLDRDRRLWVGSIGGGVDRFDPNGETFIHYRHNPADPEGLSSNDIRVIYQDRSGTLWVGAKDAGLNRYYPAAGTFKRYRSRSEQCPAFHHFSIASIYEDRAGALWIGTRNGLVQMDAQRHITAYHQHRLGDSHSLSRNEVYPICEDRAGRLWIGTYGGGLNRLDRDTNRFIHYTTDNGLPDNFICGIMEDASGDLWLSTTNGLSRFNPQKKTFRNYDGHDGLAVNRFFPMASFQHSNRELYFAGFNGIAFFAPHRIHYNPHVPPIVLTDFQLFYKSQSPGQSAVLDRSITTVAPIRLQHYHQVFAVHFAALDFTIPVKNRCAYKLIGFEEEWIETGGHSFAAYTNLDPGKYIFRVTGANNDGVWNESGVSLVVEVLPPPWRTWWAYLLYICGIALTFAVYNHYNRRRLLRKERAQTEVREATLRARIAEEEARALQAEHERKTHELKEARRLQLAMLPPAIPRRSDMEIAVYMKSAVEVGGDYYDFFSPDEPVNGQTDTQTDTQTDAPTDIQTHTQNQPPAANRLIIAVGDATGHGLKAGIMVTLMKGLLMAETFNDAYPTLFQKSARIIKQMKLGNLFMGLTLVSVEDGKWGIASAGMPPVFLYRHASGRVEEIVLKAPPLGAFLNFSYMYQQIDIHSGDILLLFSDGLPESFNPRQEMFGYQKIKTLLKDNAHGTPESIIAAMVSAGNRWRDGKPLDDDTTFVVIRKK